MMLPFFPFRKIRRNGKWLLIGGVLIVLTFSAYLEFAAPRVWSSIDESHQKVQTICLNEAIKSNSRRELHRDHSSTGYSRNDTWSTKNIHQPWKPEYKGQVNLHVFEDWCGSSIAKLRANLHYPLYAHSRTTLKKLAVSPRWTNYGLRIFGYIHPYTDGEFLFAVASDDNSELWLSMDESPERLQICAYVGKSGKEWTAPGEYIKYASQISQPVLLQQQKRYYFELIHKQNSEGTDHVEVAWRLNKAGTTFEMIDSESLSLYTNESSLKMSDVRHIPQTEASHVALPQATGQSSAHGADMLREDPRDTFYQIPLLSSSYLQNVLPECTYKPSYIIKGFPLLRYQGLQFVHLTYIYPNDYTRLTHMESDNKCFYQKSGPYLQSYGFSRYMILDQKKDMALGDVDRIGWRERQMWQDYGRMEQEGEEEEMGAEGQAGYVADYNDYMLRGPRRLLSSTLPAGSLREEQGIAGKRTDSAGALDKVKEEPVDPAEPGHFPNSIVHRAPQRKDSHSQEKPDEVDARDAAKLVFGKGRGTHLGLANGLNDQMFFRRRKGRVARGVANAEEAILGGVRSAGPGRGGGAEHSVTKDKLANSDRADAAGLVAPKDNGRFQNADSNMQKKHQLQRYGSTQDANDTVKGTDESKSVHGYVFATIPPPIEQSDHAWEKEGGPEMEGEREGDNAIDERKWRLSKDKGEDDALDQWTLYEDSDVVEDFIDWVPFDPEVNWAQTFQVSQHNFQTLRSDWIELNCNVSGNLLIEETEATAVVEAFMEKLNQKYLNQFSLQRIVNVEKRSDVGRGSRYLLELDLLYGSRQRVRLAHYIYAVAAFLRMQGPLAPDPSHKTPLLLCNPRGFHWNPRATVHFIVPVKNQARWVQQFIVDMEELYRATGDENFSIIITDYSSTDMDIEQALKKAQLPKSQYVRLSGNFQRSAGLQAGIDLIRDKHSILFLCDLHIHFPLGFIDSVRRHCVERRMAFAPIVMRLNCGATPQEPDGYWEVNGFGLLGIYKSDLDSISGMNTKEFTDRWGGEDWELLDRILQAGLEVERIYMRNFFHHFHSRRGMWNRQTSRSK